MLKEFDGENVFQGKVLEVHIGTFLRTKRLLTDWTAEMKAKASIYFSRRHFNQVFGDCEESYPDHD